jgi:hypothetical protein
MFAFLFFRRATPNPAVLETAERFIDYRNI